MTMAEPQTLPQMLVQQAEMRPGDLCQRQKKRGIWNRFTWKEVLGSVRNLALGLSALGLERGETVAIIGENAPEHFWSEFAAQAMGGKCVSVYPDVTADELAYVLSDSEAVIVVAEDQEQVDKALQILAQSSQLRVIIYWDEKGMWSYSHQQLKTFEEVMALGASHGKAHPTLFDETVRAGRGADIALLSYTSGTTGRPKGVIMTHAFLFDNAYRIKAAVPIPHKAEYLSYIPLAWATEQYVGIAAGLTVPMIINFPEKPEEVLHNIRELAVEVIAFSPRQWENLAATIQARMLDVGPARRWLYRTGLSIGHRVNVTRMEGGRPGLTARLLYRLADMVMLKPLRDKLGLIRIKIALCGGSAMAPDVFRLFHTIGVPLRNAYGTSEFGMTTVHQGSTYNLETVGHLQPVDPKFGERLAWQVSEEGELLVRGGSGFQGYYRQPEKTAEKLVDGWFKTGDAVTITNSQEMVYLERVEDMRTLSSGDYYPPQFIETRLRFSPFIKDVLVVGDTRHPFVTALVNIDPEVVARWAEERRIGFTDFQDLSQHEAVSALIKTEIATVNTLLAPSSRVRRFANFPKELDPDEGELTRTRKLRRDFLEDRYMPIILAIYEDRHEMDLKISVTYQDGRGAKFKAKVNIHDVEEIAQAAHPASGMERSAAMHPGEDSL